MCYSLKLHSDNSRRFLVTCFLSIFKTATIFKFKNEDCARFSYTRKLCNYRASITVVNYATYTNDAVKPPVWKWHGLYARHNSIGNPHQLLLRNINVHHLFTGNVIERMP